MSSSQISASIILLPMFSFRTLLGLDPIPRMSASRAPAFGFVFRCCPTPPRGWILYRLVFVCALARLASLDLGSCFRSIPCSKTCNFHNTISLFELIPREYITSSVCKPCSKPRCALSNHHSPSNNGTMQLEHTNIVPCQTVNSVHLPHERTTLSVNRTLLFENNVAFLLPCSLFKRSVPIYLGVLLPTSSTSYLHKVCHIFHIDVTAHITPRPKCSRKSASGGVRAANLS